MPRNALVLLLSLFYPTLQPAIGECVLLVELKATFVVEETTPIFWRDVLDPVAGHNVGGLPSELPALEMPFGGQF